jgi:hypothetical protein
LISPLIDFKLEMVYFGFNVKKKCNQGPIKGMIKRPIEVDRGERLFCKFKKLSL